MDGCPRCACRGRAIEPATLQAQVRPERLAELDTPDGWKMCTSSDCEVVYFRGEDAVILGETGAVPFHKSQEPGRLVCFCFGHTVSDIEADVAAHEVSTIQASIKSACKAGQDDCKRRNPQGRCCLGNVGLVIRGAAPRGNETTAPETNGCCGSTSNT